MIWGDGRKLVGVGGRSGSGSGVGSDAGLQKEKCSRGGT